MKPAYRCVLALIGIAALLPGRSQAQESATPQQSAPKISFYEVQLSKDELYKYNSLNFKGDYVTLLSPAGQLALGKTEAGVTVVVIMGAGTATIETPEQVQEKCKSVFGNHPVKVSFNSVYVRLNPKEYDETIGKAELIKAPEDSVLAKAKEIFDARFLASYHAGPKAILPPYKTRVFDFDTADQGQLSYEEGYWIRLQRISPFAKVYPSNFVNPKQR